MAATAPPVEDALVAVLVQRCETNAAQRDAALSALADLLHLFQRELTAGYTTGEQQSALRNARAVLVEAGR
jgi:hypothetical protein